MGDLTLDHKLAGKPLAAQIEALARKQAEIIAEQQQLIDTFRSVFGRIQAFCEQGYLQFDSHPGVRWVRSDSVIEILTATTEGLFRNEKANGAEKPGISVQEDGGACSAQLEDANRLDG